MGREKSVVVQTRSSVLVAENLLKLKSTSSDWLSKATPKEIDAFKRLMFSKRKSWSALLLLFFVLPNFTFLVSNELAYAYCEACQPVSTAGPGIAAAILVLQILTSVLTLCLVVSVFFYHQCSHFLKVAHKEFPADVPFMRSRHGFKTLLEMCFCALHVPPGVYGCFETAVVFSDSFRAVYSIQILNMIFISRIYVVLRYISLHNRFVTPTAQMVLSLYMQRGGKMLALKDFLSASGSRKLVFFLSFYFGCMFVFAYIVMLTERPGGHELAEAGSRYPPSFETCLWYTWNTVTTVGFGDWLPLTPLGRFVTIIIGAFGTTVGALIVSFCYTILDLTTNERKVVFTMNWMDHRHDMRRRAAEVIQAWYRSLRPGAPKGPFFRKLAQWREGTLDMHRYKAAPTDPADIVPQIKELHFELQEVAVHAEEQYSKILQEVATLKFSQTDINIEALVHQQNSFNQQFMTQLHTLQKETAGLHSLLTNEEKQALQAQSPSPSDPSLLFGHSVANGTPLPLRSPNSASASAVFPASGSMVGSQLFSKTPEVAGGSDEVNRSTGSRPQVYNVSDDPVNLSATPTAPTPLGLAGTRVGQHRNHGSHWDDVHLHAVGPF